MTCESQLYENKILSYLKRIFREYKNLLSMEMRSPREGFICRIQLIAITTSRMLCYSGWEVIMSVAFVIRFTIILQYQFYSPGGRPLTINSIKIF
jgi:hypothetical protein